jgi:GAF domain-containing protein
MRRRGTGNGPSAKGRRAPKARKEPIPASTPVLQKQIAAFTRELQEAREQQTATSEVLRVISRSAFDLKFVLQALVESAARLCQADQAAITRQLGQEFFFTEFYGYSTEFIEYVRTIPVKPARGTVAGVALLEGRIVHVPNARVPRDNTWAKVQRLGDFRTMLGVPMLREGIAVGVLGLSRSEVRPFTDKQIELVQDFAAQAVIAIENARLLNELRQSLEQQTATADVLRVISSSPGELEPVFHAMLENATRLCEAKFGTMFRFDGRFFHLAAQFGIPPELAEHQRRRGPYQPPPGSLLDRVMRTKQVSHTADFTGDDLVPGASARLGGARSLVCVPMLKDDVLIGAISIYRQEVQPFTEKQIELVQNFAAQAVIAIENARLLNELRGSLERQTATADILRVIASTPEDSKHALDTIAETASRMFGVANVNFRRIEGDVLRIVSSAGPTIERLRKALPDIPLEPTDPAVRCFLDNHQIPVEDRQAVLANERGAIAAALRELPVRSQVFTPLSRQGEAIGVMIVTHGEVQPFSQGDLNLMKGFADQAVIAIENARLLGELRQRTTDLSESLEQQTATADVLRIISSSPGELEPVFTTILENATRICAANFGVLHLYESDGFRIGATHNAPSAFADAVARREPIFRPSAAHPLARVAAAKQVVHVSDLSVDEAYKQRDPGAVRLVELAGARSLIAVPMLKDGKLIGDVVIYRQEVRPFTKSHIELVQNFAAQAVIAIENARLLNELRQRTTDLSEALEQQTATSEVLRVIGTSPGDLKLVFQAMLESAVRVCDAKFGLLTSCEGDSIFRTVAMYNLPPAWAQSIAELRHGFRAHPLSSHGRVATTKQFVQVLDYIEGPAYKERDPIAVDTAELGGVRTLVTVPMLKGDALVGAISIYRQEVRSFTDKQIALLTNFAAQAVIAIENTRLLSELRERTDEVVKLNQQLEQRVSDQVGEIERMSRLRRFLPPQVADLIVASGTEKHLESHRREITALFCDLRGFTGFSESSDPEDVIALLRDYHAAIGQIIVKYSGTLERFAGDGVMVIFNDPVPVENPALQAVLMALDMRAAIGAMIEKWRDLGHDIGFGIGIAHGFATLGTIGFEGRFDYAAIGTVSNVASRLCDEAKPGQILISPRVRQAVEKAVMVESVGEFALKGIRRPMLAYNVLEHSPSKPN